MMGLIRWWSLLVLHLSLFTGATCYAATTVRCSDVPVAFSYNGPQDLKCLCSTSTAAISFLKAIGLKTTDGIIIRIVEHIPTQQKHTLFGSYSPTSQEVFILAYSKSKTLSREGDKVFGVELTEDLWCSFAAHELAHAISNKYINPRIKAHTAGEYISSVVQLAVLTPETREKILKRYIDVEAYQSREEMSELYYLLDPNRFAVKCYRHFIALKEPVKFIDLLIHEGNGY